MALSVSRLVRVAVNLSPLAAARRSFGVLLVATDSSVISGSERLRTFESYDEVAEAFGVDAPATEAAALYFGQTPSPRTMMVGRWLRTAAAAFNKGGILTATEQLISSWSAISNGGFIIVIDGVTKNLSGLDFSGVTNLNGVADVINGALTGGSIEWNGEQFILSSDTTGDGVKSSGTITLSGNPSAGAQASGTIELTGQPDPADTVELNSTTVTFVSGTPGPLEVQIGGDTAATANNLFAMLQASANAGLAAMTYSKVGNIITARARVFGTAGNAYTLDKSGANISVSGSGTLAGGVAPDTLTVNGTLLTFVSAVTGANQILVGPTSTQTSANIQAFLQASTDTNIDDATYETSDLVTTVTYKTAGTAGDAFTLAKSSSAIDLSGTNLSGGAVPSSVGYATTGSGTDISALLKLTSATSIGLTDGFDAETPAECVAALANKSAAWYGIMFNASVQPTDDQNMDVAAVVEALSLKRIFGVTITNTDVLSAEVSTDLASRLKALSYRQSFSQYSSSNGAAIASFFGRAFTVDFAANRSTITMMFKQEPGVAAEDLSESQATTLQNKRCNVFVSYVNDTAIIEYGTMAGPYWFDEVHGLDWFQDAVQNNCYNVLYTSKTKVPQTDAGVNQLTTACGKACDEAVNNGLSAPGVWNADGFGQLENGQYLKSGYYVYAPPISSQSQADREARKSPPIQIALKLAGAIQELDVLVDVNR